MTTVEKKKIDHDRMKRLILNAAKELFAKDGFENVSIRKIASCINYSPAALYRYFQNKEDIILCLKQEGMQKFGDAQKHLADIEDPFERVKECGRLYLTYASNEPEYYDLLFNKVAPSFCDPEKWAGKPQQSFLNFKETVRECIETGVLGDVSVDTTVAALWACVHGLASLTMTGRLKSSLPDIDIDSVFENVLCFITIPQIEREKMRKAKFDEDKK
ncbi:TetR/AcrR family transcriptional regulator [Desulfovibrio sp. UCD-KL4C]|uniref:TetR/AcrR family transcriptional regulator n=1 Tax=Desulfovibrio sp. UCD-KL4C TaxID=2578120 RepID=UPI0025C585F6|nr:TetR/AcrR family transcriptional regulator [Desulfovibrio sp. UCD-KL4C]